MGIFTPHEYTWVSPRKGLVQIAAFIATFLSVCYVVKATYPDRPSFPREFEGGLERELGGSGAKRVSPAAAADSGSTPSYQSHHSSGLTYG
jgi:NADH dehydrogenase (ubiquinone) 1 beta subcomplex subunit 8